MEMVNNYSMQYYNPIPWLQVITGMIVINVLKLLKVVRSYPTWSIVQKICASSCWKRRTRVKPVSVPDNSLRCSTPKSAIRNGSSRQERGRWSNITLIRKNILFYLNWYSNWRFNYVKSLYKNCPISSQCSILYPQGMPEKQRFFYIFRGYRNEKLCVAEYWKALK